MRPRHELGKYDGGYFSRDPGSFSSEEVADPIGIAEQIIPLLRSQDPEDRRDARRLAFLLTRAITCPDRVWVVQTEYLPDQRTGKRWSDHVVTWSAHLTREEAERWQETWRQRLAHRSDYGWLPIHQENGVHINQLRHPDADPERCVPKL